jgi:hypothetical protein
VIEVTEGGYRFLAEDALLAFVPFGDDIPDETAFGIDFDLVEAFLAAALSFGPAGALFEA